MEGETNAAITGAIEGGATDIVVNDSHGSMFNLTPTAIDRRARLVQGRKPFSMVEAAAGGRFDLALFVGYHARAGHPHGTIAHTYSAKPTLTTIDGRAAGEYAVNALYLGALGVPVGLVTGDDALADEVAQWLPWAERVVVKRGISWQAADSLHPDDAREAVAAGARRAVERCLAGADDAPRALTLPSPIMLGIDFQHAGQADFAAVIPGFERIGDRGVRYAGADAIAAYRAFLAAVRLAGVADD
jgi:D-amino peptidase